MPREEFKRAVDHYLTDKETEPWEILYFKAYESQLPVIEKALEAPALMLGGDKSRRYCLEMICADFLAGVSLGTSNQDALRSAITRLAFSLPVHEREQLIESIRGGSVAKSLSGMAGAANRAAQSTACKSITFSREVSWVMMLQQIW
jgi:hypothetical protein